MADGKFHTMEKKTKKSRRIRGKQLWVKEEKEIKELEARCREVSSLFFSRGSAWVLVFMYFSVH